MKVIIEQRHTENCHFGNDRDCALCRAIKEQYPSFEFTAVGLDIIYVGNEKKAKFFPGFTESRFLSLQSRKIKSFEVNIDYPQYDQGADKIIEKALVNEATRPIRYEPTIL